MNPNVITTLSEVIPCKEPFVYAVKVNSLVMNMLCCKSKSDCLVELSSK